MADLEATLAKLKYEAERSKLYQYRPYGHPDTLGGDWSQKPWQWNFHAAGASCQERMLMAANRVGKTRCAAFEVAYHMTGDYPEWWTGRRFDKPVLVWTGSPTNETSRDIVQKELLGGTDRETIGTGSIPKRLLIGSPKMRQAGVSDVVDVFKVRHRSGGVSQCTLKTYEQGWRKWQGTAPDVVWMDEEPEDNELQGRIYSEALTRLLTSHGVMMVTFTPLLGETRLVRHYVEHDDGVFLETATWDDAPHLHKGERERLANSYPEHEREARTHGVPMLGEGRVFTVPEPDIICSPFAIPPYFARIKGMDFGLDHPAGFAELAWDRDSDIIYLTRSWKKADTEVEEHAQVIIGNSPWVPVAWPHDGANREKSNGVQLKDFYRRLGVKMLGRSARYDNDKAGPQAQWPVIEEIRTRERTGGFKVFATCTEYLDERRNYHLKGGKLVSKRDDALKACFYAVMMRRYATTESISRVGNEPAPLMSMRL